LQRLKSNRVSSAPKRLSKLHTADQIDGMDKEIDEMQMTSAFTEAKKIHRKKTNAKLERVGSSSASK
jgi:hypothetical protein